MKYSNFLSHRAYLCSQISEIDVIFKFNYGNEGEVMIIVLTADVAQLEVQLSVTLCVLDAMHKATRMIRDIVYVLNK